VTPDFVSNIVRLLKYLAHKRRAQRLWVTEWVDGRSVGLWVCLFLAQQSPVGQSLLIHEVSRSHTTTHHSL